MQLLHESQVSRLWQQLAVTRVGHTFPELHRQVLGFASSTWLACIGLQYNLLAIAVGAFVPAVRVSFAGSPVRFGAWVRI